jgi:hypothetical protein
MPGNAGTLAVLGLDAAKAESPARIRLMATRENRFIKCLYLLDGYHFHFGSFLSKGRRVSAPFLTLLHRGVFLGTKDHRKIINFPTSTGERPVTVGTIVAQ